MDLCFMSLKLVTCLLTLSKQIIVISINEGLAFFKWGSKGNQFKRQTDFPWLTREEESCLSATGPDYAHYLVAATHPEGQGSEETPPLPQKEGGPCHIEPHLQSEHKVGDLLQIKAIRHHLNTESSV